MPRAKKVSSPGRLGPRYGTKIRKLVLEVERKLRQRYRCQNCGAVKVKRVGASIWQCGRCGAKFAGAAYSPSVLAAVQKGAAPVETEES